MPDVRDNQIGHRIDDPRWLIRRFKETGERRYLYQFYRRESYRSIYAVARPKWIRKFRLLSDMMDLKPGQKVLDVGCASQMLRPHAEAAGAIYKGLDISPRFSPDYVADAETMEGVEDEFDWAVFSDVLEHLPDPDRAMRRARQVAERIVAVVPNWYRLERFRFLPRHPGDRHIIRRSPKEWIASFQDAGWVIERERGFFHVPSIAFYPVFPLRVIDKLFTTAPFIWISDIVWERWAGGALRYMGQELIIVGRRKSNSGSFLLR